MAKKAICNNWCEGREFIAGKIYTDAQVKGLDPRDFEDVPEIETKAPEVKKEEAPAEVKEEAKTEAPAEVKPEAPKQSASVTRRRTSSKK